MTVDVLTFSSLYPNAAQPQHGIFVEQRLRHLTATGAVRARVVAPVPWFPFDASAFGPYAVFARVPRRETRFGIEVSHPRYPVIPKIGTNVAPLLMSRALLGRMRRELGTARTDLLDAHFLYPDGVAAVALGERLGLPVVVTARGSDVNYYARAPIPRRLIRRAAERADAVITVSRPLKERLVEIGVAPERITVLRNGVDLLQFRPLDRERCRTELGLEGRVLLSVGHLRELKGNHLTIEALACLPDATLIVAGEGGEERRLRRLAASIGVATRVRFAGRIDHEALAAYYSAADVLVLASSREGWPNVVLEVMACGTPVVATAVGGVPDMVSTPAAGQVVHERSVGGLRAALDRLFGIYPDPAETRRHAESFSWDATSAGQRDLFARVLEQRSR